MVANEIKDLAKQTADATGEIKSKIEGIQSSTVSCEIARDIAEVNQASSEMSNSSSQVNISAENLSKPAKELKEMVGRFKV